MDIASLASTESIVEAADMRSAVVAQKRTLPQAKN